jgi:hypothetical protein
MERYGQRKRKYWLNPFPIAALATTIHTLTDLGSKAARRGKRPATNRLSHGRVFGDPKRSIKYFPFSAPYSGIALLDLKIPTLRSHVLLTGAV